MSILQEKNITQMFLSYSWNDSELANKIDCELTTLGFGIKRDIRDIGPWTSIKDFMSSIKLHDYVIMIISSSYLKSPNCMYEVMELLKSSQYKDRIFSIVTSDADIYNPVSRAKYITYWEEETKKLEEAIRPLKLENTTELTMELRKYKSIEMTIASFLDLISDKNNPNIVDAVDKIKEVVCKDKIANPIVANEKLEHDIKIKVEACHYAFLKFSALEDVSGTAIEKMVGIKKLDDDKKQDIYDLPMLRCVITNRSQQERCVKEPMIQGKIKLKDTVVDAIGFMIKQEADKRLVPGGKTEFTLHGAVIINIIKAFFENKIKSIYVEDNFGFRYYVSSEDIKAVTEYFRKYCLDLKELEDKHKKYCL